MSTLSANVRRLITRKRNDLVPLLKSVDELIDRALTNLSREELVQASNQATRFKCELSSTLTVVTENGRKWQKLIEGVTDRTDKEAHAKELNDFFEDSGTQPHNSIESLHDVITTKSSLLDGVVLNTDRILSRMSLNPPTPHAAPIHSLPSSTVVTPSATVPLPSLPNLTLPSYDGKSCWDTFWKTFSELIDKRTDLGDSTKLRYLESSLCGEASDLLSHLMKRSCGYNVILTSLENEYKSTVKSHKTVMKEFGSLRPKSESLDDQLKTIRHFETLITLLKGMDADPDNNVFCRHNVLERFSPFCQKFIHMKIREGDAESTMSLSHALSVLKQKLKDELELRELCPRNGKEKVNSPSSPSSNTPITTVTAQAPSKGKRGKTVTKWKEGKEKTGVREPSSPKGTSDRKEKDEGTAQKCIFCELHSNSRSCWTIRQVQKRELLAQQGRCLKCFQHGHITDKCSLRNCEICGWAHHFSVCNKMRHVAPYHSTTGHSPRENNTTVTKEKGSSSSPVPVTVTTSTDRIRMLTGSAIVSNPTSGASDRVEVFLDSGAGLSLISNTIRDDLSLPTVRREHRDLAGLGGKSTGSAEYDVVQICLSTNDGPLLIEAVVHSEPLTGSIPMATLSRADKRALKNQGVRLADSAHRRGRVQPRLLIGGKDFYRVTGMSNNQLPSGLYVVNTTLGVMIAGEKEASDSYPRSPIPITTLTDVSESPENNRPFPYPPAPPLPPERIRESRVFSVLPVLRPCVFVAPRVKLALPHSALIKETLDDPDYVPSSKGNLSRKALLDHFRQMEATLDKFWDQFHRHYVTELREHHRLHPIRKCRQNRNPFPIPHEIVLVVEENVPRGSWKMAKVIKVNERDVTLLPSAGQTISRPANRIIPLELVSSDTDNPPNIGLAEIPPLRKSTRIASIKARDKIARETDSRGNPVIMEDEYPLLEDALFDFWEKKEKAQKGGRLFLKNPIPEHEMPMFFVAFREYRDSDRRGSHKRVRVSITPLSGPWSFSGFCLALLFIAILAPAVTSESIECHLNGARFNHELMSPPYQICGDGDCTTVHPDPHSPSELTVFDPAHTVHGFTASVKYLRGGSFQSISVECPAFDFCATVQCVLCLSSFANPECNLTTALVALGCILYVIGLFVYALCFSPLTLSRPIRGVTHIFCGLASFSCKCVFFFLMAIRRLWRGRTAMQQRQQPIRQIIFLSFLILLFSPFARSCQDVIELTVAGRKCVNSECSEVTTSVLKVNPITKDACIALVVNNTVTGQIKMEIKDTQLICDPDSHAFHRDVEVKYVHAKRCPHTGSCVGPKCGNVTMISLVHELEAGNKYPGHTFCQESCGGPGCDCFWLNSGCLFYRTFCEPRSNSIYQTFECPEWRPIVTIEVSLTIGNETRVDTIDLRPNVRASRNPYELELTNFAVPPLPILGKPFIYSLTENRMAVTTHFPNVLCESKRHAEALNCSSEEECHCLPTENSVTCDCKQSELEKNFDIDKVFPMLTPQLRLTSRKGIPEASLYQSVSTEITVVLQNDQIKVDHQDVTPIQCAISTSPLIGCYGCMRGAKVAFRCLTKEGKGLATLKCSRDSFSISCDSKGVVTERALSFQTASVSEICISSCGDPVVLRGVLQFAGFESESSRTQQIQFNGTVINLPDFEHIATVFIHYWMETVFCLTIVVCAVSITIWLMPFLLSRMRVSLSRGRRGSNKVVQKEL